MSRLECRGAGVQCSARVFIPLAMALYLALKAVNRNAMLVGSGLLALFVILDMAVTWPNYAALIRLSGEYAAATGDAQRTVLARAASYKVPRTANVQCTQLGKAYMPNWRQQPRPVSFTLKF